jgi:hypothetical protein
MSTDVLMPNATMARSLMTELRADRSLFGSAIAVLFLSIVPVSAFQLPWWVSLVPTVLFCTVRIVSDTLNPLQEPVVRVSSTCFAPGEEVMVECELRAKQPATVRDIRVGLESVETRGESTHTETYGEWAARARTTPLGATPAVTWLRITGPVRRPERWSGSTFEWYVTLSVELDSGAALHRRYPCG